MLITFNLFLLDLFPSRGTMCDMKKKVFIGYVPKGENISETIEHWNESRLNMLTLKQWKDILDNDPDYDGKFTRNEFSKRIITITVKDEEK